MALREFNPKAGATAIGARDFLIAYNVNLNTTSVRRANSVAFDVREQGRVKREGNPITGKVMKRRKRRSTSHPRRLQSCERYRLVHRRIWHCSNFNEFDKHQCHSVTYCF